MTVQAAPICKALCSHGSCTMTRLSRTHGLPSGLMFIALLAWASVGSSQVLPLANPASAPAAGRVLTAPPARAAVSRPSWAELTAAQQQALAPLASSWNTGISEPQKRKWLAISSNFSSLPPEGQATLNSRMNEWVALSPQQRARARLNFGETKELARQLTPEEKKSRWEAYQALSPEEKHKLAAKASPNPTGAATAVKPVPPQKLAAIPQAVPAPRPETKATNLPASTATPRATAPAGNAAGAPGGATPQR